MYISLAKSLINGQGYIDIWDPAQMPHPQYPPVFPGIVAIGLLAGVTQVAGFELLMIVITTAAVFTSCAWLTRVTKPGIAASAGLFIAISPEILRLGSATLSDTPFWLFSILALLLWRRADRNGMPIAVVIGATAATLAAYFTLSAGAPLLLAVMIWLAWIGVVGGAELALLRPRIASLAGGIFFLLAPRQWDLYNLLFTKKCALWMLR